jgi:hypothetical protein
MIRDNLLQEEAVEGIPVLLDPEKIGAKLHVGRTGDGERIRDLVATAQGIVKARALYKVAYIEKRTEDALTLDGVTFRSRVLKKNLDGVGRAFPYVLTIGADLEARADACEDLMERYYLDTIGNVALEKARRHLQERLRARFAVERISYMSPGSLEDWPLTEQEPLFSLLDDVNGKVGVRLTDSCLMIPRKSISGIFFATEATFYSCQLCPRGSCPGRKAPYSEALAREYGLGVRRPTDADTGTGLSKTEQNG